MKKLNNKGFAITTLLYGLLSVAFLTMTLLMGIMSTNRQNTSTLVDRIEEELNRYGETETTFAYLGESQEYVVPYGEAGWYKIELWGASTSSGYGDYTSGVVYLEESAILYFYLGQKCGVAGTPACSAAFNQGNTEVRVEPTAPTQWNDATSLRSTIMRAANGYGSNPTSFISGMAGMNSVNSSGSLTNQTNHYSGRTFINGLYVQDVNNSNGKANVELISKGAKSALPPKQNNNLNSVRYIKNCTSGSTANTSNHIVEIQAIRLSDGKNLAKGKTVTLATSNAGYATDGIVNTNNYTNLSTGTKCSVLDLGGTYELSEIGIWHYFSDKRSYYHHTVSVSTNNSTYTDLKKTASIATSEKESYIGYRYSAWQPNTTTTLPNGNYYIFSTTSTNNVLTSQSNKNVVTETFQGKKLQKWTIEQVDINSTYVQNKSTHSGKTIYKIYDSERINALQLEEGTAESGENVVAQAQYRGYEWDLWEIIPLGNGNYQIKSLLGTFVSTESNDNTPSNVRSYNLSLSDNEYRNRWKFVNAEH